MFDLTKDVIVGVSVNQEQELEVAQVDFNTKTVIKYAKESLTYDNNRKEIADIDIFKETLTELFAELQIPKGSEVVLNFPNVAFKVNDYPASLDEVQVCNAILEELAEHPIFEETEPTISVAYLPGSTVQFNKIAYTALQQPMLIEIVMQLREMGYIPYAVDTSVNSTLNALIYSGKVDCNPNTSWVLMLIENNNCKIISLQGKNYIDYFEEDIAIGEFLEENENYNSIAEIANPIIKNLPSSYLCVVSKTNTIRAEALASKLVYNAPVVHLEANVYAQDPLINVSDEIPKNFINTISADVIGAAIKKGVEKNKKSTLNLFNKSLGEIYEYWQPLKLKLGSHDIVMSLENSLKFSMIFGIIIIAITLLLYVFFTKLSGQANAKLNEINNEIESLNTFLKNYADISSDAFDEGFEINLGLAQNRNVYSYYTIVGTEIPQKLWLTRLSLGANTTIEGQADNLESVYSFYRNLKDYDPASKIKLQQLGLSSGAKMSHSIDKDFDAASILTSLTADSYQFRISDASKTELDEEENIKAGEKTDNNKQDKNNVGSSSKKSTPPYKMLE